MLAVKTGIFPPGHEKDSSIIGILSRSNGNARVRFILWVSGSGSTEPRVARGYKMLFNQNLLRTRHSIVYKARFKSVLNLGQIKSVMAIS